MPRAEDFDEFCDPENPYIVSVEDITEAADVIRPYVTYTPCIASHYQKDFVINLYYKMEQFQKSGSFKERGAVNYLKSLPTDQKKIGIVVASLGNDAISLCYYARKLHVPVTVVLPNTICIAKAQKCHELGGKVLVQGKNLIESQQFARAIAREKGQTYFNSRDRPELLAGYGTVGLEILEQLPSVDAIIVPVGSGGLVSAVATIVKQVNPMCLVYGIQAESMPAFFNALEEGDPLTIPVQATEADSLGIQVAGVNAFNTARPLIDKMLLVKEDWIAQSILHLVEKERVVVEGGGACSLAAIIGNLVPELKIKNVVCVLTGGNIDAYSLSRCVDRGLAVEGRLIKFSVGVKDTPAAPTQLMRLLAAGGYNVVHQLRNREWVDDEVYNVEFKLVCETQGLEHALDLKRLIERAYPCNSTFETEPFNDKTTCPCYVKRVKNIC